MFSARAATAVCSRRSRSAAAVAAAAVAGGIELLCKRSSSKSSSVPTRGQYCLYTVILLPFAVHIEILRIKQSGVRKMIAPLASKRAEVPATGACHGQQRVGGRAVPADAAQPNRQLAAVARQRDAVVATAAALRGNLARGAAT